MFVRYRMLGNITIAQFKTDVHNIITGNVASVNDLSAGADKANCIVGGNYPTGTYTVQNAGTYTYSKVHNADAAYTHYFRLTFDSTSLTAITLAQSYTVGSDTLVNSSSSQIYRYAWQASMGSASNWTNGQVMNITSPTSAPAVGDQIILRNGGYMNYDTSINPYDPYPVNIAKNTVITALVGAGPYTATTNTNNTGINYQTNQYFSSSAVYTAFQGYRPQNISVPILTTTSYGLGIDFVITSKCFFINAPYVRQAFGIFDIAKNGLTRTYTNSMLMTMLDLYNPDGGSIIPYTYKYPTQSYGSLTGSSITGEWPLKQPTSSTIVVAENPTFLSHVDQGWAVNSIYSLYKIPGATYYDGGVYTDGVGVRRSVANNFAVYTE